MARVLLVEPHPDVRDALAAVCETWRHDVATATDGPEALAIVAVFNPKVVVLDLGFRGGLDNVEVANRIRSIDGDQVFIIALTGWTPVGERAKVLEAAADAVFVKPPNLDELEKTLAEAGDDRGKRRWS
jgi:DNA-binding response OmpR family regulator